MQNAASLKLNAILNFAQFYFKNPTDCGNSQQLLCKLNKGCGFGCQFHHLIYCFMIAFGTQRTLILDSKNWRYNSDGWETIFQPVSDTCTNAASSHPVNWKGTICNQCVHPIFLCFPLTTLTKIRLPKMFELGSFYSQP